MPAGQAPRCLLLAAVRRLPPGKLKAGVQKQLGIAPKASKRGLINQILKVAYQSETQHAHAWEHMVATLLTRQVLQEIANNYDDESGPKPRQAHNRGCTCEQAKHTTKPTEQARDCGQVGKKVQDQ